MADVRSKLGAPILDDFNSSSGTPIVCNQTTGGISVLKIDNTIQEMALVGGSSSKAFDVGTATTGTMAPEANQMIGRNLIVNGSCQVDQVNSGAAQTITAAAALAYTIDQWYAYCTGANVTGQQVIGSSSSNYGYKFTGAASVTGINFATRMESINTYHLAGTTASFQVILSNSLLTSVTWTAYYANSNDSFGTLASPTVTQIATGVFTVNTTDTVYQTQISIPAEATTGIQIVLSVGAQTSGTWQIKNIQLEAGSFCTTFERKFYGQILRECQRYLPFFKFVGSERFGSGYASSTTTARLVLAFPIPLRASTNAVITDAASGFTCLFGTGAQSAVLTALALDANGILYGHLLLTVASGLTAGSSVTLAATSSTKIYFTGAQL